MMLLQPHFHILLPIPIDSVIASKPRSTPIHTTTIYTWTNLAGESQWWNVWSRMHLSGGSRGGSPTWWEKRTRSQGFWLTNHRTWIQWAEMSISNRIKGQHQIRWETRTKVHPWRSVRSLETELQGEPGSHLGDRVEEQLSTTGLRASSRQKPASHRHVSSTPHTGPEGLGLSLNRLRDHGWNPGEAAYGN